MKTKVYIIKGGIGTQLEMMNASFVAETDAPLFTPKTYLEFGDKFGRIEYVKYCLDDGSQSVYLGFAEQTIKSQLTE